MTTNGTTPTHPDERFDPSRFRLDQNYAERASRKVWTTVRVGRPDRERFFRAHPDPTYQQEVLLYRHRETRDVYYLIDPPVAHLVAAESAPYLVVTALELRGDVFLWPIKLPRPDGRTDEWSQSAVHAATLAETQWIRLVAPPGGRSYEARQAAIPEQLPAPVWPEALTFAELFKLGFREHFIDRPEHPIIHALQGRL
jgi:hypothetical protein